jgi:hypothetical protein
MQVKLRAFDQTSSACYSNLVKVNSQEELDREIVAFEAVVPFHSWSACHTTTSEANFDAYMFNQWMKSLENGIDDRQMDRVRKN